MKILSMTATFGKLEHETLTLKPGMNVIQAPNEWGKSTWCAFLVAMLYGLDTRAKSTRAALADKDHFAPWSGSPMSGSMDVLWGDRRITIERTTKGRIPMGNFRAFETDTGLDVPELNAANCGQVLLGVESSVFRRAGFVRLSDLPVTQDDALRRRLNALVTTGDESGDGARLEKGLKELKNRCRYNRTGLLPQAEQEREQLQAALSELDELTLQSQRLENKLEANAASQKMLRNHAAALRYAAAQRDAVKVEQAEREAAAAEEHLQELEISCASLPTREEAIAESASFQAAQEELQSYQEWQHSLPMPPEMPKVPRPFLGVEPEDAEEQVEEDIRALENMKDPIWQLLLLLSGLLLIAAMALLWLGVGVFAAVCVMGAVASGVFAFLRYQNRNQGKEKLIQRYGTPDTEKWRKLAKHYKAAQFRFRMEKEAFRRSREELSARRETIRAKFTALGGAEGIQAALKRRQEILSLWDQLDAARHEAEQTRNHCEELRDMARPVPPPAEPDSLTHSREETRAILQDLRDEQQRLQAKAGEFRGRMEALGSADAIKQHLRELNVRIAKLEKTNAALALAQQTLTQASQQLQRRFAPRIAKRAQETMQQLTNGRYERLILADDLTLQAAAAREDTLHDAQWRSEGTVDQLYLALRLAVAEELTPDAPLILDDALVRFDDSRMQAALSLLHTLSQSRQVILFSCQTREKDYVESMEQH